MGEAEVGGGGAAGDKGPGEAATSPAEETVVWSPEVEVCLFHAMLGHKPVGVNRHFHMICIRDKFSQNIGRQVPSKVIWDHLSTMYDMQALHESEILPFPNPERNFVLPEEIIQEVREGKVVIEEEMKEEMKEDMDPHNGADDGKRGARHVPLLGPRGARCPPLAGPPRRAQPRCPAVLPGPLQPRLLCLVQQLRGSFPLLGQEPRRAWTSCARPAPRANCRAASGLGRARSGGPRVQCRRSQCRTDPE
ncbi:MRG domain binding protein [Phyllostomus discolor]|uniref:MRG domain binding protein n=1 Tax=Phyllostomus discolor TaxID=89673 RepID=A0A834DQR2_9CHIR|nr:MRG domain binding protein [Phyllostomus discolor]